MRAICVDNFKVRGLGTVDDYFYKHDLEAEDCARKLGVEFIHTDLLTWSVPYAENSIDAVMSFDNLEHLHHSPRRTYQQLTRALREQGIFLLGGPNAANLLKRIRILFGGNVFSSLNEWYFHDKFIGHVREPVVDDFLEIAQDLNLHVEQIKGRNWLGYDKYGYNFTARLFDNFLRSRPSLCSDIYLLATKQP
jgi:SAM-dependent methyltransferase